jgi:hypothetical protein
MAVPLVPETSFILLLQADSEHALPDSDPKVVMALASYRAAFKRTKKEAPALLELLAGLMWVHAHQHVLHVVWSAASEAQHSSLAAALHLKYDLHAQSCAWHTMIISKVLSCIAPGATQEKRQAPDGSIEGQSHVPGQDVALQDPSPVKAKKPKSKPIEKPEKRPASSSSSCACCLVGSPRLPVALQAGACCLVGALRRRVALQAGACCLVGSSRRCVALQAGACCLVGSSRHPVALQAGALQEGV